MYDVIYVIILWYYMYDIIYVIYNIYDNNMYYLSSYM